MESATAQTQVTPRSVKRGGAALSPLHIAQMVLATAILIASSALLIAQLWAWGLAALVAGTLLCLIHVVD